MIWSIRAGSILVAALAMAGVASSCSSGGHGFSAPADPHFADPVYARAAVLSGPVAGGTIVEPLSASAVHLPPGWVEQEYFASGTAYAFTAGSLPADGRWSASPTTPATYRTRIIVRRPTDPARFNGTVVVEWMNVSSGESSPDWTYLNPELTNDGFAYVAVSAQELGVDGGKPILGNSSGGLVAADRARYGSLHHPGDRYSYDIFAQIGRALRASGGPGVLGALRPKRFVAVGESQSAFFLTTFANAVQPLTQTFDGLFIHSRGGAGAPLDGRSITSGAAPAGQRIRTDLAVPVFMFETQTDLVELGYASARQPDTSRIRTWEAAGTSHADAYIVGGFASQLGCKTPVNDGPQHEIVQAAFAAFDKWVTKGTAPPSPDPFRLAGTNPVRLAVDGNGNVVGGVRTPAVDVPVSTLSGAAPAGTSVLCSLFGSTTPFTAAQLTRLYGSRSAYLSRFTTSLDRAISSGYILPADRASLLHQARAVPIP